MYTFSPRDTLGLLAVLGFAYLNQAIFLTEATEKLFYREYRSSGESTGVLADRAATS